MRIVTLTYTADLAAIDAALDDHRQWLHEDYADGAFLVSGAKEPRTGGVIVTADISRDELDKRLADDPFRQRTLADYTVITINASRTAAGLEQYIR